MRNIKQELRMGYRAVSGMVWCFAETFLPLLYRNAGYDLLLIDMEHAPYSYETVRDLILASRQCGLTPFVRVPKADKECLQKVWDMGACGVAVPMVETAEQAKEIVRLSKYPPMGQKGMGAFVGSMDYDFGMDPVKFMEKSNDELFIVIQPETVKGVENIEAILSVEGIDGIMDGRFDLSTSLGIPTQFENPVYLQAREKVIRASASRGKMTICTADTVAQAQVMIETGANVIMRAADHALFYEAIRNASEEILTLEGFR